MIAVLWAILVVLAGQTAAFSVERRALSVCWECHPAPGPYDPDIGSEICGPASAGTPCEIDGGAAVGSCDHSGTCLHNGPDYDPCEFKNCGDCRSCDRFGRCVADRAGALCYVGNSAGQCNVYGECQLLAAGPVDPCDGVTCGPCQSCRALSNADSECVATPGGTCEGGVCSAAGVCQASCDEVECNECHMCSEGQCVPDPDGPARCESGRCNRNGECTDPCDSVDCGNCRYCDRGQCLVDSAGTVCYVGSQSGSCNSGGECQLLDPCAGVTCGACQTCSQGQCVVTPGATCVGGICSADGVCQKATGQCAGVTCGTCQACSKGKCVVTPGATCEGGICNADGVCQGAGPDPCAGVTCGACQTCSQGQCVVTAGATCEGGVCSAAGVCQDACTAIGGFCFQASGKTRCPSECTSGCVKASAAKSACPNPSQCFTCN